MKPSECPVLATDVALYRELEREAQAHGYCALSIRQLAEKTGITHKIVNRSLGRLAGAGRIQKIRDSFGNCPTAWAVRDCGGETEHQPYFSERMTPRDGEEGTPDLFRRRDLSGPGVLYGTLQDSGLFSAEEALAGTSLTANIRTVEWWLLVLASQLWPLVEEVESPRGRASWRKLHLSEAKLKANVDHLLSEATATGRRPPKTQALMRRQHQRERLNTTVRSAVPREY